MWMPIYKVISDNQFCSINIMGAIDETYGEVHSVKKAMDDRPCGKFWDTE